MKVVLDTNVVVAAFATRGLCESILELCLDSHDVILTDHLLDEIRRNLIKKIKLPEKSTAQIITFLRENATVVKPAALPADSCRDPTDIEVLGAAVTARADVIVTGDDDLLILKRFRLIPILSPKQFSKLVHEK